MLASSNLSRPGALDALRWIMLAVIICLLTGRRLYAECLYLVAAIEAFLIYRQPSILRHARPWLAPAVSALVVVVAAGAGLDQMAERSSPDSIRSLMLFPVAAGAMSLLGRTGRLTMPASTELALLVICLAFIAFQLAVVLHAGPRKFGSIGSFSNPHYLALYGALSLPVLVYLLIRLQRWQKWLPAGLILLDTVILLKTQSRPAWLALPIGALAVLPFLSARQRWTAGATLLAAPAVLAAFNPLGFRDRLGALLLNLAREERVTIWSEAAAMQADASAGSWLWGHGFAGFAQDFTAYSSFHGKFDFTFPHNFFLEGLYVSGLPITLALTTAAAWFIRRLVRTIRQASTPAFRHLGLVLLAMTIIHLSFCFLTVPLYSRYTLIPLSLMLGTALWLFECGEQTAETHPT